jgi:hypothetical protein
LGKLGSMGGRWTRDGVSAVNLKMKGAVNLLILRRYFSSFWPIFHPFGQFRSFFEVDFPVFVVFSSPRYGILANESGACTMAHRRRELKPRNWAPKVTDLSSLWILD